MKTITRRALLTAGLPLAILLTASTEAAFLPGFEGFTVMGSGVSQCPICDSTVSFAVWQNTDGNWLDDLPAATALGSANTGTELFVYLYQIVNTNPLGGTDQRLENFNISYGDQGAALTPNPFVTGGFLPNEEFVNVSNALVPLDVPDDGSPSTLTTVTQFQANPNTVTPDGLNFDQIAHFGVGGGLAYPGVQFQWNEGNEIQPNETSAILYLTSNLPPKFRWAETESPGGFGAAGDVPSLIPLPASVWFFGSSLLALIGIARRKTV